VIYVTCHICLEVGGDRAAEPGSLICRLCLARTQLILGEILDLYEWISDPEYLAGTREPASQYTKSRPPVSLHTVALLDPRTKYRRKGDPVSAVRVLKAWNDAVWTNTNDCRPLSPSLADCVWYLKHRMDWIAAQPAVVRFARHMSCVLHSLKQEVGIDLKEDE
jgi:hypothetical protein